MPLCPDFNTLVVAKAQKQTMRLGHSKMLPEARQKSGVLVSKCGSRLIFFFLTLKKTKSLARVVWSLTSQPGAVMLKPLNSWAELCGLHTFRLRGRPTVSLGAGCLGPSREGVNAGAAAWGSRSPGEQRLPGRAGRGSWPISAKVTSWARLAWVPNFSSLPLALAG